MRVLIDNNDFETVFSVKVLNYTSVFDIAAERVNERTWVDKSGVDKNLTNPRLDSKEFVFDCIVNANTIIEAYEKVALLCDYMLSHGCFVLSIVDITKRVAFLCERSTAIIGDIRIRPQNSLYSFKLGLKDVNPNAVKYQDTIDDGEVTINYERGQNAVIYWGNGDKGYVSNSGSYTKDDYDVDEVIDIIVDVDKGGSIGGGGVPDPPDPVPVLVAAFSGTPLSGIIPQTVQFTDASTGSPVIWSWNFGDGQTSSEQNPSHIYTVEGPYTVTLQIFNSLQGSAIETKTNYVTVRRSRLLINGTDSFLKSTGNKIVKD